MYASGERIEEGVAGPDGKSFSSLITKLDPDRLIGWSQRRLMEKNLETKLRAEHIDLLNVFNLYFPEYGYSNITSTYQSFFESDEEQCSQGSLKFSPGKVDGSTRVTMMFRLWHDTKVETTIETLGNAFKATIPEILYSNDLEEIVGRVVSCEKSSSVPSTSRALPSRPALPGVYISPFVGNISEMYIQALASEDELLAQRLAGAPPSLVEAVLLHPCVYGKWDSELVSTKMRFLEDLNVVDLDGLLIRFMGPPKFISGLSVAGNELMYISLAEEKDYSKKMSGRDSISIHYDGGISLKGKGWITSPKFPLILEYAILLAISGGQADVDKILKEAKIRDLSTSDGTLATLPSGAIDKGYYKDTLLAVEEIITSLPVLVKEERDGE